MLSFHVKLVQTDGQTDGWTDGQTDNGKTICPSIFRYGGHKNGYQNSHLILLYKNGYKNLDFSLWIQNKHILAKQKLCIKVKLNNIIEIKEKNKICKTVIFLESDSKHVKEVIR